MNGGIKKLKNLTFLFKPNLNLLGMLVAISVFLILFSTSFIYFYSPLENIEKKELSNPE